MRRSNQAGEDGPRADRPRAAARLAARALTARLAGWALALWLAGCGGGGNPSGVGNRCTRNADCPAGECYLGPGGGYCTAPCAREGDTAGCPRDTVCKPIQGGAHRCLLVCGSDTACSGASCEDTFCPAGSSCVSVDNATLRACEPNP